MAEVYCIPVPDDKIPNSEIITMNCMGTTSTPHDDDDDTPMNDHGLDKTSSLNHETVFCGSDQEYTLSGQIT